MPPKAKKDKIIWNNSSCKADKCLQPPSKSIWVKCDVCGYWYHEICIGVNIEDYPDDLEFYCYKCHPAKLEEYDSLKAKLLIKVRDLADAQKDFGGPTISRDMFKEKKNANQYNFSNEFPPTLADLCSRISGKFKTFGEFKYEAGQWVSRLKELLLDKYESDLQFIDWEFKDYVEDLLKGEDEEEPVFNDSNEELDVTNDESTNNLLEKTVIKTEIAEEDFVDNLVRRPSNCVHPAEVVGKCEFCSCDLTETIYLCKRKHKICHGCRTTHSGCVCPQCYQEHGDRKRLIKDPVFQNDSNDAQEGSFKHKKMRKDSNLLPLIGNAWSVGEATSKSSNPDTASILDVTSVAIKQEPDLIQENLFSSSKKFPEAASTCAIESVQSLHPAFTWNSPHSTEGRTELIETDFSISSIVEEVANEMIQLNDASGPSIQLQENVMFSEEVPGSVAGFANSVGNVGDMGSIEHNVILTEVLDVPEEAVNQLYEPQVLDPFHALQQCSNQEQSLLQGGATFASHEIDLENLNPRQLDQNHPNYWIQSSPQNVSFVETQNPVNSGVCVEPVSQDGWIRVHGQDIQLPRQPVQAGQPFVVQTRSLEESRHMKELNSVLSKIPKSILDKIPSADCVGGQDQQAQDSFVQGHPMPVPRGNSVKGSGQQVQNNSVMFQKTCQAFQNTSPDMLQNTTQTFQIRVPAQETFPVPSSNNQKLGLHLVSTSKLLETGN